MRNTFGRLILICALGAGCAQQRPVFLRAPMPENPVLFEVSGNLPEFTGRRVRWGGMVVRFEIRPDGNAIEIVERKLDSVGRPVANWTWASC